MLGRRVPMILQSEAPECGIACVAMVASYHGFRTDLAAMRMRLAPSMKGVTLKHIATIAETMGLAAQPRARIVRDRLPGAQATRGLHWCADYRRASGRWRTPSSRCWPSR